METKAKKIGPTFYIDDRVVIPAHAFVNLTQPFVPILFRRPSHNELRLAQRNPQALGRRDS